MTATSQITNDDIAVLLEDVSRRLDLLEARQQVHEQGVREQTDNAINMSLSAKSMTEQLEGAIKRDGATAMMLFQGTDMVFGHVLQRLAALDHGPATGQEVGDVLRNQSGARPTGM